MLDPQNDVDRNAVAVRTQAGSHDIGYVGTLPRFTTSTNYFSPVARWTFHSIDVARVNSDAPLQNAFAVSDERFAWPDDFRPCAAKTLFPCPSERARRCEFKDPFSTMVLNRVDAKLDLCGGDGDPKILRDWP